MVMVSDYVVPFDEHLRAYLLVVSKTNCNVVIGHLQAVNKTHLYWEFVETGMNGKVMMQLGRMPLSLSTMLTCPGVIYVFRLIPILVMTWRPSLHLCQMIGCATSSIKQKTSKKC